jgi:hypothetical protein
MIAYISPLIPKKTGIAQYSHHLIMALQTELAINHETIDIFDDQVAKTNSYQQNFQASFLTVMSLFPNQGSKLIVPNHNVWRHCVMHGQLAMTNSLDS